MQDDRSTSNGAHAAVYAQTNAAEGNQVLAFRRGADGALSPFRTYDTGGSGTGKPHLASQSSVVLSDDGRLLVVVNTGSDDVSVFSVDARGLELMGSAKSGGRAPTSVAVHGNLLYVLNSGGDDGEASISGFRLGADGTPTALPGSTRPLSRPDADPAQISFSPDGRTLVVTERATDSISTYAVDGDGLTDGPTVHASSGKTPYGFDFTRTGAVVVTEAAGAQIGAASASSYALSSPARLAPVSGPIGSTRSEVCWAAISKDDRFVYVTNFGDGTISSYSIDDDGRITLIDAVAATTIEGEKGIRDEALTSDGRYLYALHTAARKVFGWEVGEDGSLSPIGAFEGVPATVAGLAAS